MDFSASANIESAITLPARYTDVITHVIRHDGDVTTKW